MAPERFSGATQTEPSCFAAERGPDTSGTHEHSGGPFFLKLEWELSSVRFRVAL